jgi:hypothetical protein
MAIYRSREGPPSYYQPDAGVKHPSGVPWNVREHFPRKGTWRYHQEDRELDLKIAQMFTF